MKPFVPRYAVYYVPERDSLLERLGASLLGRDMYTGGFLPQPDLDGVSAEALYSLTHDARRYGLHATLKPPFFLKPGTTEAQLIQAAERFARARRPLPLPPLAVDQVGSFFALTMHPQNDAAIEESENIRLMAREAVSFFDRFRAPPSGEELARRRRKNLTPLQEKYLLRWGYPYVFEEFRFHITLMDASGESGLDALLRTNLEKYMGPAMKDNWIEAISICRSDWEGLFTVLHRAECNADFYSAQAAPRSATS